MPEISKISKDFAYYTIQFDEEDEHSDTIYRFYFCEKEQTYVPKSEVHKDICSCGGHISCHDFTIHDLK